jgi:hypothetical protein
MKTTFVAVSLMAGVALPVWGASPQELERLGKDLTAVGAEKGPNKDGTIPAWSGMDKAPPGWSLGKLRMEHWKHKAEKPSFFIDASNVEKYADKLSPGQIHLLKTVKGYTMPVYPTHRECGYPDFVLENTRNGAAKSKIGADGWSLESAALPGVPFPIPANGIEAVWNFQTRYQGVGANFPLGFTHVSPSPGSDKGITVGWTQLFFYPWAAKGTQSPKDGSGLYNGTYYGYVQPAALAGQAIVQRYYFDKDNESFYYFTGQRRVRRLPSYAYDAPLIGFENQYPADMPYILYGNPNRFVWKLVGKKEIYIPYNNFALRNFNLDATSALKPTFVSADVRRYELHRVWEVEGTVKNGVRHSAPKKTLYLDEDTWLAVLGDDFDAQGKLWKSKEAAVLPTWEVGACTSLAQQNFYDFASGRYVADNVIFGAGKDFQAYSSAAGDARLKDAFYTSESLRAISDR